MHHGDVGAGALFRQRHIVEHMVAARKAVFERRLAAVLEDEQVLLATQTPAPAFLSTPVDQSRRAVKPVAHQRHARAFGQQRHDRLQSFLLFTKADRALRLLHAPSQRQGAIADTQRHHQHLMRVVDLALVDHRDDGASARRRASQNLARERRHHVVDLDEIVAEHPADPLIAHVEPLGLARQRGGKFVQVDAAHLQRRRDQQGQAFALLLVLPRQPRQKLGADARRNPSNPTHSKFPAESRRNS